MERVRDHHYVDEGTKSYQENSHGVYCDLKIMETELISSRTQYIYIPIRKISSGHFSTVFLAFNKTMKQYVAVKICKCDPEYESAFKDECEILQTINSKTRMFPRNGGIVEMKDWFVYEQKTLDDDFETEITRRHYCFVMELLGHSILKLMLRYNPTINSNKAVPLPVVKTIAKSLLQSVDSLHKCGYIHTDIKPENIALQYFLPEIEKDADYKLPDLIFGKQSRHIFDSKLCTPAIYITAQDFERMEDDDKMEAQKFLIDKGRANGIHGWLEIKDKIMDKNNYKQLMSKFIHSHPVNESDARQSYRISGMNIFNVSNLMRDAEKIFRLCSIESNDPRQHGLGVAVSPVSPGAASSSSAPGPLHGQASQQDSPAPLQQGVYTFKSARSGLKRFLQQRHKREAYEYRVIDASRVNTAAKTVISDMGMAIQLSDVTALSLQLRQVFAEKLYYDQNNPETIKQLAASGLHSRFALLKYMQANGILHLSRQLPRQLTMTCLKCFALTSCHQAIYPVMISYFKRDSLIPFCTEMFQTKLLDLGNAYEIENHRVSTVQTRQYRSPEVMLHCQYDEKADIFSAACVVFELLTGNYLFGTRSNSDELARDYQHLRAITKVMGNSGIDELCSRGNPKRVQGIKAHGTLHNDEFRPISAILVHDYNFDRKTALEVEAFLEPMLRVDPDKRVNAEEALKSSWLNDLGEGDFLINYGGRFMQ